jgi:hypothetical protein
MMLSLYQGVRMKSGESLALISAMINLKRYTHKYPKSSFSFPKPELPKIGSLGQVDDFS